MKGNCSKLERWNGTSWDAISKKVSMTAPSLTRETVEQELVIDCDPAGGNPFKKKSPGTKEIGDISLEILWNPVLPTGTHQVETATGAGTVTVAGNALVTITAAGVTGSPIAFNIPVPTGSPTIWMSAVRTYLLTNAAAAALRDKYAVSGATDKLILTSHVPQANDSSLNIALATGTATGITGAPTSAHTTPGVAGEENDENHQLFEIDFQLETATFWRIVHPNAAGTGCIVHATVKEIAGEEYTANQNVKRTVTLEPTGEFYKAGNAITAEVLPSTPAAPVFQYGHH